MNDRDSEALAGLFVERGYSLAQTPDEADVILVNTCSVREHAEERAISFLGTLKKVTRSESHQVTSGKRDTRYAIRNTKIVGLIGCMARNRGEELFKRMPHIDLICGPAAFDKIPEYVEKIQQTKSPRHHVTRSPVIENKDARSQSHKVTKSPDLDTNRYTTGGSPEYSRRTLSVKSRNTRIIDLEDKLRNEDFYRATFRLEKDHAQVVISTGCSNYCSYCLVPYVRGPLRLRRPEDIISEVERNVKLGIKKITLLGQNVNDYHYKSQGHKVTRSQENSLNANRYTLSAKLHSTQYAIHNTTITFIDLLRMVEEVNGVEEIDFVTSNPKNTSRELFELMAHSQKIKKHLHLPFQSGSDRILKLMNRGYTKEDYLQLVDDYYRIVGGTLSTDVIVGFPTETEEDFLETKEVLQTVKFRYAYIFKYSPRPHTKAAHLDDDVPKDVKERRHRELLGLQKKISLSV